MIIQVMSRNMAVKESYKKDIVKTAIISITDISAPNAKFNSNRNIFAIQRVKFNDEDRGNTSISNEDAKIIADFVRKIHDKVDRIIVHCEAGRCRSAGVAAAIMKFLNGDDMPIFKDGNFTPNMRCYRMVMNQFFDSIDEKDVENKEQINLDAWKEIFKEVL